jgi:hypothetical protein
MIRMHKWGGLVALARAFALPIAVAVSACSNSGPTGASPFVDSGTDGTTADVVTTVPDGGDARLFFQGFPYPQDPGAGAFYVTISGESNALTGYPFPPDNYASDTYMPDGWEFQIQEYIVVVDKITLSSNPDLSTSNQEMHGSQIAHLDGPFVVDLHKGGKITGQGGYPEQATPIGAIRSQNDNNNQSFDTTSGTRYAFGFSTVPATYNAYNVNLDTSDPQEMADFATMVQKGYSVFYRGVTVWQGNNAASMYACVQTNAGAGEDAGLLTEGDAQVPTYTADGGYDFSQIDKLTFSFTLGFPTPTNYVNCQNMTGGGMPLPGEDYARGVAASGSQSVITQVTVHMDHPFWESFEEDTPVHWDNIAAQYVGSTENPVQVNLTDFIGVPFHPWFDKTGTPLPWRNCVGPYYTPPGNGQMFFSTLSVPIDPTAPCTGTIGTDFMSPTDNCKAIRDYYDYIRYTQSTQGHLNSQGLCFIDRQYPAPAGGS